jgi:hypothetical protein
MAKIDPKTDHPVVGKKLITKRYLDFRHAGRPAVAVDARGDSLYVVFPDDPNIWMLHRSDFEA